MEHVGLFSTRLQSVVALEVSYQDLSLQHELKLS